MSETSKEGVYLLHFQKNMHGAQHYIGFSGNIEERLRLHRKGQSQVALTRAVSALGIEIHLVRIWEGKDRNFERRLKNFKNARRLCPICNPQTWENNGRA